jgi:hypothetical protein
MKNATKSKTAPALNKTQLARKLGVSRPTIHAYLARPGAPLPDPHGRYALEAVAKFISAEAPRAGEGPGARQLRERKLRVQCERLEFEFELQRGLYVLVAEIDPGVAEIMRELTANLETEFVHTLPPKCRHLSEVEIQEWCREAILRVLTKLKSGSDAISREASGAEAK